MPSEGLNSGLNLDCISVIKFEQLPTRPVKYELHLGSLFEYTIVEKLKVYFLAEF